jgi:hypothetical protein
MTWQRSGELIVVVVLGGLASLHGAIIGAAAFLLLEEVLSGYTEHWKMIFGPLLVLVVLYARGRHPRDDGKPSWLSDLRLDHSRKAYGALVVTDDVSLDIRRELHAIIGPNGAGKTTLSPPDLRPRAAIRAHSCSTARDVTGSPWRSACTGARPLLPDHLDPAGLLALENVARSRCRPAPDRASVLPGTPRPSRPERPATEFPRPVRGSATGP